MAVRGPRITALPGVILVAVLAAAGVAAADGGIPWRADLSAAQREAATSGRPVVLLFSAVWCPACRELERSTLRTPEVEARARDFLWVRVDLDRELALARQWGVKATPTFVVLDAAGWIRRRIEGAPAAAELAGMLAGVLAELAIEAPPPADAPPVPPPSASFLGGPVTWTPEGYRAGSICFGNVGYGPLNLSSQSPLQSLRLAIAPHTPSTLARGEWQVRGAVAWANVWANDDVGFDPAGGEYGDYLLDYETLHLGLGVSYGLADTLELELEVEDRSRFGGTMDGFVQGFHDLFGLEQSGRELVPRDQLRIRVEAADGRTIELGAEARGSFSRSLMATLQHNVTCGTASAPAVAWAVTVRHATISGDLEGGGTDLGVSLALSQRVGRVYGYLTLGFAWYGSDEARGIPIADTQATALLAGEWRFAPRQSLVLQWLASEAVSDFGPFAEAAHEVTIGWKGEVVPSGVLEIGVIENMITFDNSPDFGLHMGYAQRF